MPQIASELGLDALVYTRKNPTGKTIYWSVSPDGSQILTLCPGHYSEVQPIFNTKTPLTPEQLDELNKFFETKEAITPDNAPLLVLAGADDYALAPVLKQYPSELLQQWTQAEPDRGIEFSTLSKYVDLILPGVKSGRIPIPTHYGGTAYDFDSFWIENPTVKTWYRRNEHALQATEILATIASLQGGHEYPVKSLYDSWMLMFLNMDRNTLWGSAGGMVFVDAKSWDAQDRFEWVQRITDQTLAATGQALLSNGQDIGLFNPLNWKRDDPIALRLPDGKSFEGIPCEAMPDGSTLCRVEMPAISVGGWRLSPQPPETPRSIDFLETIETKYYFARIDRANGAITSLKMKNSGDELLGGPANVIVAERPLAMRPRDDPGDHMPPRSGRKRLAASGDGPSTIHMTKGPVAITVQVKGNFYGGGAIRRVMRFYHDHPRIDFETELNDVPNFTVVVAEFPLSQEVLEIRRGIPFGFSHGSWTSPNPELHGWTKGIVPARQMDRLHAESWRRLCHVRSRIKRPRNRWTYADDLSDERRGQILGLPKRLVERQGQACALDSILGHESEWQQARIPQMAWEYNRAPVIITGRSSAPAKSFVETSSNVILEAMRREGNHIEIRLLECLGVPAKATVKLHLPHSGAAITDFTGRKKSDLQKSDQYEFPVRPQQIITMQFETSAAVPTPEPIKAWDAFVPQEKLTALHTYDPNLIGHPPFGA